MNKSNGRLHSENVKKIIFRDASRKQNRKELTTLK